MNNKKAKTKRGLKSITAVAMAAAIVTSMSAGTAMTAYAATPTAYTAAVSSSAYRIPTQIYMTQYTSGAAARAARAQAAISSASALLADINTTDIASNPPAIDFTGIGSPYIAPTKYDFLIKPNADSGAAVLTFNSQANLNSAMSKIKTEEQTIMNNALAPYRSYIDTIIANGAYTKAENNDVAAEKAAKLGNAAILSAVKNALVYTYTDTDLFSGDVTGSSKTYQIGYLSESSVGTSTSQTVVANDEEFTNFPKLIIGGRTLNWDEVHHLSIFGNSNDSWWFALKDGNTLNNDYYWLNGMMIPDFADTLSFDAYAGSYWAQYGAAPADTQGGGTQSGDTSSGTAAGNTSYGYYYNKSYDYVSDYIYAVTGSDGRTFYYPNSAYANAAVAYNAGSYISSVTPARTSASARYFCFFNGVYYETKAASPLPDCTAYMASDAASVNSTYSINGNGVYDSTGRYIGTLADRGYSSTATWFCLSDGRFYPSAQNGKPGYYVNNSLDSYGINTNDPYYTYYMMRIAQLQKENNSTGSSGAGSTGTGSSNKTSSGTASSGNTETIYDSNIAFVSAEQLAALRASGDTLSVKGSRSATWIISGNNVVTAKDINLRVTFGVKNIPDALKKEVMKNANASSSFTVGENLTWGTRADLTIKYKDKYANFIAKLYRYDTATGTLILVDTATIGNTGAVTFHEINHGGDYIAALS